MEIILDSGWNAPIRKNCNVMIIVLLKEIWTKMRKIEKLWIILLKYLKIWSKHNLLTKIPLLDITTSMESLQLVFEIQIKEICCELLLLLLLILLLLFLLSKAWLDCKNPKS